MVSLVKTDDLDHAEWLREMVCEVAPTAAGLFDRIDGIHHHVHAARQGRLGNRVGNDIRS